MSKRTFDLVGHVRPAHELDLNALLRQRHFLSSLPLCLISKSLRYFIVSPHIVLIWSVWCIAVDWFCVFPFNFWRLVWLWPIKPDLSYRGYFWSILEPVCFEEEISRDVAPVCSCRWEGVSGAYQFLIWIEIFSSCYIMKDRNQHKRGWSRIHFTFIKWSWAILIYDFPNCCGYENFKVLIF